MLILLKKSQQLKKLIPQHSHGKGWNVWFYCEILPIICYVVKRHDYLTYYIFENIVCSGLCIFIAQFRRIRTQSVFWTETDLFVYEHCLILWRLFFFSVKCDELVVIRGLFYISMSCCFECCACKLSIQCAMLWCGFVVIKYHLQWFERGFY